MSNKIANPTIIPPKKFFIGNPSAGIILMEFGEYENEVCAKAHQWVKKLLKQYEGFMKFNFRHFPLIQFHQHSHKASEAAVAALQEGKFWEMHEILLENRHQLGVISLKEYAKEAGLTNKKFLSRMVDSYYGWTVRADLLEGLNKGLREAPVFFVNGERVKGTPSLKTLSAAIELALATNREEVIPEQKS